MTLSTAIAPLEKIALETYVPPAKPSLVGLSRAELGERLGEIGVQPAQRKMRTAQLWHWIYVRGAKAFDEMTSISKDMRAQLEAHFTVARPEVVAEQVSNDGTRKWLLRLPSGDMAPGNRTVSRTGVRISVSSVGGKAGFPAFSVGAISRAFVELWSGNRPPGHA